MKPTRPSRVPAFAKACLDALSSSGLGRWISLGGAFGLAHYLEYRETHDVDAWWIESAGAEQRRQIVQVLQTALGRFGEVRVRSWGDVVSVEFQQKGRTVFSFQIARRSAQLHPSAPAPWPGGILVDSLEDLIASKMVALVERGSPRDFRDIFTLCQEELADVAGCWELWEARQRLSGENEDRNRAALGIRTHLARIEQARPLDGIAEMTQRTSAQQLRAWFARELLRDLPD